MITNQKLPETIPEANIRRKRKIPWIWMIPFLSLAVIIALVVISYQNRGVLVHIAFQNGHGLKEGDAVKYRGIEIGFIRKIHLSRDLKSIQTEVILDKSAREIAGKGSRFWIVRPRLGLSGADGLDTVIGANYITVLPGDGEFKEHFMGLETPPFMDVLESGGLEITLWTSAKGSLSAGAPVSYRQIVIGTVMTVDLSRDAGSVEASLYILPDYAPLICENTRFWKTGGASWNAGLKGFSFQLDSLRSLVEGGVNAAIPPDPGRPANDGHRFTLHDAPDPEWLAWKPFLDINPPATENSRPAMVRAKLSWVRLFQQKERTAWVLPFSRGFLGPKNVFDTSIGDDSKKLRIWIDGKLIDVISEPKSLSPNLAVILRRHDLPIWPDTRFRRPRIPENTVITTGGKMADRYVEKTHYTEKDGYWDIDDGIEFDSKWNGACVLSDRDSRLIGILIVENDSAIVAPAELPAQTLNL